MTKVTKLVITIKCGEKTCASEPYKFCQFLGSVKLGQVSICTLFNGLGYKGGMGSYTILDEVGGWTQRCQACLNAEKKAK